MAFAYRRTDITSQWHFEGSRLATVLYGAKWLRIAVIYLTYRCRNPWKSGHAEHPPIGGCSAVFKRS